MKNGIKHNEAGSLKIVTWDNKFATGIDLVDSQHQQLFKLTNELYAACFSREHDLQNVFKEAMKRMVDYVRFHFNTELKILEAIQYPDYQNHKKMHDSLIKDILDAAKGHNEGKKFVPNNFVRTLVEWISSHIAFYDKQYSLYALEQIKKGVLTRAKLKEIEASATV